MRQYIHRAIARVYRLVRRYQLVAGIVGVIAITGLLTAGSMILYVYGGTSGLDLSGPRFDAARDHVNKELPSNFSATGKLTPEDIETYKKQYEQQRAELQRIGSFDDQVLSDESLGLVLPSEPSITTQ